MTWLTVFARSIRRIEILDEDLAVVSCSTSEFADTNDIGGGFDLRRTQRVCAPL